MSRYFQIDSVYTIMVTQQAIMHDVYELTKINTENVKTMVANNTYFSLCLLWCNMNVCLTLPETTLNDICLSAFSNDNRDKLALECLKSEFYYSGGWLKWQWQICGGPDLLCSTVSHFYLFLSFLPSVSVWHCWLGDSKGIRPVKKLDAGLLVMMIWLELCTTYSSSCHHHLRHPLLQ